VPPIVIVISRQSQFSVSPPSPSQGYFGSEYRYYGDDADDGDCCGGVDDEGVAAQE
jgi:hypothetical protein